MNFGENTVHGAGLFAAPGVRDDAESAKWIAADRDGDPSVNAIAADGGLVEADFIDGQNFVDNRDHFQEVLVAVVGHTAGEDELGAGFAFLLKVSDDIVDKTV